MEEKIKITAENEHKIYKSIVRIAEYYVRASKYITRYMKEYTEEIVIKGQQLNFLTVLEAKRTIILYCG